MRSLKYTLNKISFLKCAGINKIIFIEVYSTVVKFVCLKSKEPFYKILGTKDFHKLEITAVENHPLEDDFNIVSNLLKKFIDKNNLHDLLAVVGVNDFKFSNTYLPADVEDAESWFYENTSAFLPAGKSIDEFAYSYEKYKSDEILRVQYRGDSYHKHFPVFSIA